MGAEVLVLPISYLLANLIQWPAKLSENMRVYGSRFRGLPRKEQIYTILPIGIDEIFHSRVFKSERSKLLETLSNI